MGASNVMSKLELLRNWQVMLKREALINILVAVMSLSAISRFKDDEDDSDGKFESKAGTT